MKRGGAAKRREGRIGARSQKRADDISSGEGRSEVKCAPAVEIRGARIGSFVEERGHLRGVARERGELQGRQGVRRTRVEERRNHAPVGAVAQPRMQRRATVVRLGQRVRARLQEDPDHAAAAAPAGRVVERREALVVPRARIGSRLQQMRRDDRVRVLRAEVERGEAFIVARVRIRARLEQEIDDGRIARPARGLVQDPRPPGSEPPLVEAAPEARDVIPLVSADRAVLCRQGLCDQQGPEQ